MKIIKYKQRPEFNRLKSRGIKGILSVIFFWCLSIWFIYIALKDNGFFSSIALLVVSFLGLIWVGIFYRLFPRSKWVWKTLLAVILAYVLVVVLFRKPENETKDSDSSSHPKVELEDTPHRLMAFSGSELIDNNNRSATKKWGLMDNEGKIVVPPKYDRLTNFSQGLMAVKSDSLWGYINEQGEEVIPPQYNEAKRFTHSLAAVKSGDKWGYIDLEGQTSIPFQYDSATPFNMDGATVTLNGVPLRIDRTGTPVD